jgi:hypothetical protein
MDEVRRHSGWDILAMTEVIEEEERARKRAQRRR